MMKKTIQQLIDVSVKNVDIYYNDNSTWLIFTDTKQWVIELTKDRVLWYNYSFFKSIFSFLSLDVIENQQYITEWVENTIQNGVKDSRNRFRAELVRVENTIQNGVKETKRSYNGSRNQRTKYAIENGVKEIKSVEGPIHKIVKRLKANNAIENGFKEILPLPAQDGNRDWGLYYQRQSDITKPHTEYVKDVINNGVKEIYDDIYHHKSRIEGVLKKGDKL
jgi:hypothetical protein